MPRPRDSKRSGIGFKEVRDLQKDSEHKELIGHAPFRKLVKGISIKGWKDDLRWDEDAVWALHVAVETYTVGLL